MDEDEFKATYAEVNERPCVFAKAILTRCAGCSRQQKLLIAEREAVACASPGAHDRCAAVAGRLRDNALFALRMTHMEGPLPHGKEIKVQCGGLRGLCDAMGEEEPVDVSRLMEDALRRFGSVERLPYVEIVKAITGYKPRQRSRRG